jgi:uncharacterized protein
MAPEAFFLTVAHAQHSQRFCLFHPAQGEQRGAVLYLHPFAEEMNKSRRMAALQSRRLAEQGYAVLQIDLLGCGDSAGDFGDASWQGWLDDVLAAHAWLRERHTGPLWLWGLRAGCLLATDVAKRLDGPVNFLFWQPVISGKTHLQQFLRLKVADEMMGGNSKGVMAALKESLAAGQSVEIAGYVLSPALAQGLEAAELTPPARAGHVVWLEVASRENATLAPTALQRIEQWQAAGFRVASAVTPGLTFWQTTEIEEVPALLAATTQALCA